MLNTLQAGLLRSLGLGFAYQVLKGVPGVGSALDGAAQEILYSLLEPGGSFCDVGAGIGLFSLGAARVVGQSGEVVALESDPENFGRLVRNVERNAMHNVRTLNVAAWSSGGVSSGPRGPVERARLDALLSAPPDLIKVEVEGAEAEVLRGAGAILRDGSSTLLVKAKGADRLRQVAMLLSQSGYAPRVLREESAPRQETYLMIARPESRRSSISGFKSAS
jgi:precorrin-6B methylase 2